MKKLLLVLAIGSFAVACNNSGGEKSGKDTTTAAPTVDTTKPAPADTTKKDTAAAPVKADTTKK